MKKHSFLYPISVLLGLIFQSCSFNRTIVLKDADFQGLSFEKVEVHLERKSNDTSYIAGVLKENRLVDGYPCNAGNKTYFSKSWNLTKCRLSEEFYFYGTKLPRNTWLWISSDNQKIVCTFPDDVIVQGYALFGNNDQKGKKGLRTTFYPTGELCTFYPKEEVVISGYICRKQLRYPVSIYPNGSFKQGVIAEPYTIDGVDYPKNTWIMLDENGKVLRSK